VGKDKFITFCIDYLRSRTRGVKITRRGFADKIYELCHSIYGWAGFKTKVYYDEHPECKNDMLATMKTVRQTLIEVGQHLRKIDDDIWVNTTLKTVDCDILFLSDLRFPTEFLHCQANKALMVRIIRPGLEVPTDEADTALDTWTDRWNLTVENNGELNDLYNKATAFCNDHLSFYYR
jgi:hypothetical protein